MPLSITPEHDTCSDTEDLLTTGFSSESTLADDKAELDASESCQAPRSQSELLGFRNVRRQTRAALLYEDFDPVTGDFSADHRSVEDAVIAQMSAQEVEEVEAEGPITLRSPDSAVRYQRRNLVPDGTVVARRRVG